LKYSKIYIKISFQKDQPYLIIYYFHLNWIHFYWPIFLNSFLLTIPLLLPQVFSLFPYNIKKININLNLLYLHKKHLSMLQIRQLPIYQEYVNNNGQLIYLQNHFFFYFFFIFILTNLLLTLLHSILSQTPHLIFTYTSIVIHSLEFSLSPFLLTQKPFQIPNNSS
jgi:hypothetical protein